MVVAIDGPAGAGKSTVARLVARALGFTYLDTGAMYRTVALGALEHGVSARDREGLERLVVELDIEVEGECVMLNGADVSERIRMDDVTSLVSEVSSHAGVRRALMERQRAIAGTRDVVMEGRDIGATVVPEAGVKVFLTASLQERAKRRAEQLAAPAEAGSDELERSLAARDEADATRSTSPLAKAEDAVEIDSTNKELGDVVAAIVDMARRAHAAEEKRPETRVRETRDPETRDR